MTSKPPPIKCKAIACHKAAFGHVILPTKESIALCEDHFWIFVNIWDELGATLHLNDLGCYFQPIQSRKGVQ